MGNGPTALQAPPVVAGLRPSWPGPTQVPAGYPMPQAAAAAWQPPPATSAGPPPARPLHTSSPTCRHPGCGKPTFDGKPGFCSERHRDATCQFPGCSLPPHEGKPGYCNKTHRDQARAIQLAKLANPGSTTAAPSLVPSRGAAQHAGTCRPPAGSVLLAPGDPQRQKVWAQFCAKWPTHLAHLPCPADANVDIYEITMPLEVEKAFRRFCKGIGNFGTDPSMNPGNRRRRFHGTNFQCRFRGSLCGAATSGDCPGCSILMKGFKLNWVSQNSGNAGSFGKGHYSTSTGGTSFSYAKMKGPSRTPVVIVCTVAAGNPDIITVQSGTTHAVALPQGCHSRVVVKSSLVDELMVPRDEQMLPRWIIVCP